MLRYSRSPKCKNGQLRYAPLFFFSFSLIIFFDACSFFFVIAGVCVRVLVFILLLFSVFRIFSRLSNYTHKHTLLIMYFSTTLSEQRKSSVAVILVMCILLVISIVQCLAADSCVTYNVDCGAHGVCSGGTCFCTDGYTGTRCTTFSPACAAANCGLHGECALSNTDGQSTVCSCMTTAWNKADCSVYRPTSGIQCTTKWYAASDTTCKIQLGNDQVYPQDVCVALTPNSNAYATMLLSKGTLTVTLYEAQCTVLNAWGSGFFASQFDARCTNVVTSSGDRVGYASIACVDLCQSVSCGSYGTCGAGGQCTCNSGYTGSTCATPPQPSTISSSTAPSGADAADSVPTSTSTHTNHGFLTVPDVQHAIGGMLIATCALWV
jgi:hypothetical protein